MTIAFDFDGALADSFAPLYAINESAARQMGHTITTDQYRAAFKGPIHVELRKLLALNEQQDSEFRALKRRIFAHHYNPTTVKLHGFVPALIRGLAFQHHLIIVTAAPRQNVDDLLAINELYGCFRHVIGGNVAGKREALEERLVKGDAFVTDTLGDLREAHGLRCDSIGVTWGFHDKATLLELEGTQHVLDTSEELRKLLTQDPTSPR